jgi:hypothetical protein
MSVVLWIAAALAFLYAFFRWNRLWIGAIDRAGRNAVDRVSPEYEQPRYYREDEHGRLDFSRRWPGWDGWYFFLIPKESVLPAKMIRGSVMTGVYGLEGIDNYEKLSLRLSTFQVAEFLSLVPTEERVNGFSRKENNLSQHYFPRESALQMDRRSLNVTVSGARPERDEETQTYGHVSGAWPNYRFEFHNPEAEIEMDLAYKGRNLLWWADVPGVFTYFAAFGDLQGSIIYRRGSRCAVGNQLGQGEEVYQVSGMGCFEHGFARKLFDFDPVFLPVRLAKRVLPGFRPIRYHYELFVDEGELHGGFMVARGFGIDWRNRGGVFDNGAHRKIGSVKVTYHGDPDIMLNCSGESEFPVPSRWTVTASLPGGKLEYTATREFSPSTIADNMTYYYFHYEGTCLNRPIRGRGYGEYVHL